MLTFVQQITNYRLIWVLRWSIGAERTSP